MCRHCLSRNHARNLQYHPTQVPTWNQRLTRKEERNNGCFVGFQFITFYNHFLSWLPQIEKISAIPWQHSEFLAGFCLLHMSGYGYCGHWPPKKLTHGSSEPESAPHRSDHLSFQGRFGRIRLVSFTDCSKIALFEGTHI